uniref:Uncharacterized protein n=1 Tax=Salix viminalis TaxID=40686 RepID=A0A6N2N961_SALVM
MFEAYLNLNFISNVRYLLKRQRRDDVVRLTLSFSFRTKPKNPFITWKTAALFIVLKSGSPRQKKAPLKDPPWLQSPGG